MVIDKTGLTIQVTTYMGIPRDVNGVPTLDSVCMKVEIPHDKVINDPYGPVAIDIDDISFGDDTDLILANFERDLGCKVAYLEHDEDDRVRRFDVFEPAWIDHEHAVNAGAELTRRLLNLTCGRAEAT